jgi:twitching motility two-component system response regulator PilG
MRYAVALCGLTARDARLLEIVITRAPALRHAFVVGESGSVGTPDVVIVDVESAIGMRQLQDARALNPRLVAIFVSEHGLAGDPPYRIAHKSLLLSVLRTLEQVIEQQLTDARPHPPVRALPAATPAHAWPSADGVFAPTAPGREDTVRTSDFAPLIALVVDDSAPVRESLKSALERSGIQCVQAEDAAAAQRILAGRAFDLAFLDVVMPGTDGYDLCRQIKHNPYTRQLPVLMLTSRSSPFDRARGALAGCNSYLVKPIAQDAFFNAVDKVLSKRFANDRTLMAARGYRTAQAC